MLAYASKSRKQSANYRFIHAGNDETAPECTNGQFVEHTVHAVIVERNSFDTIQIACASMLKYDSPCA
jgi:hypothetical protein